VHGQSVTADPRRRLAAGALLLAVLCVVVSSWPWLLGVIALAATVVALVALAGSRQAWASAPAIDRAPAPPPRRGASIVVIEAGGVTVWVVGSAPARTQVGDQPVHPARGWTRLPGERDPWLLDEGEG